MPDDARAQAKTAAEGNPGTHYVVARIVYGEFEPIAGEQETLYQGA